MTSLSRRQLFAAASALPLAGASKSSYRIGITTNTRGGWETDVWLSFREAREVGYVWVESFWHYFTAFAGKPAELKSKMDEIGVRFVTISNGAPMETHFEDPSKHAQLLTDHVTLAKFIRALGCSHLKINLGARRAEGTTDADLVQIAKVLNELGRRTREEGIRLAVHAHMWNQFENRREVDYVMKNTDPQRVFFVLDTGHITMAGMNPVELARTLGHRILEFHMKDCKPEWRGGAKIRYDRPDMIKDPPFFPLGHGGVDFPAIKTHLDSIGWQGFLTVELDTSPFRPPKESARISLDYLRKKLGLDPSRV